MEKRKKFILEFTIVGLVAGIITVFAIDTLENLDFFKGPDSKDTYPSISMLFHFTFFSYGVLTLFTLRRYFKIYFPAIPLVYIFLNALSLAVGIGTKTDLYSGYTFNYTLPLTAFLMILFFEFLPGILTAFSLGILLARNNIKFNKKKILITVFSAGLLTFMWFNIGIFRQTDPFNGLSIVAIYPLIINFLMTWSIDWKENKTKENVITEK